MYEYEKKNLFNAKTLRKNMTPWERKLWYTFINKLPVKFYRQKLVSNFILDFYCASKKIAIELDGSQHYNQEEIGYDERRTKILNEKGIKVLRYTNSDIDKRFNDVCEDIYRNLYN